MTAPLISCIVPVFNGERYLREALDSIFAQTYRCFEVIVVDDGSTDGTASILGSLGERIRSLRQCNQGPAAARNLGVRAAGGELVAFLDADDLWHAQKLARQVARFRARPELQYCVSHAQNFWVPELQAEATKYREHRISQSVPGYVTQTLMARRAVFDIVGLFKATLAHADGTEWFLRAAEFGIAMELLPDVLTYRRLHPQNRSRLLAGRSREEFLEIVKASLDRRRAAKPAV
jgi:glycosyltransferase involved in cell wall biosynthesis